MHAVLAVPDTTPGTCVLVSTHTCMLSWLYQTLLLARVSLCRHTHACCPGCTRHYSWHLCPCVDTHMHAVLVVPDTTPGTCVLVSTHSCMLSWLYQTLLLARVSLCRHTHACCPGCTRHYSWHVCPCVDTLMHAVLAVPDTNPGTCVLVSTHTHACCPGCTRHYSWHVCPCVDTHTHACCPGCTRHYSWHLCRHTHACCPGCTGHYSWHVCPCVDTHTGMLSWLYQTLLLARVSLCRHTHACSPGCTGHYSWHVCPCVDTHMHAVLAVPDTTPGTCVLVSTHTQACCPGCTRHYSWHVCPCVDTHMHAVLVVPDTNPGMCVLVSTHTCMLSWLYRTLILACVSLCRHTHACYLGCTRHYSWHVCPCVDTHMHAVLAVPDTTPGTCVDTHMHAVLVVPDTTPGTCVDTHMHAVLVVPDTTPGTCVLVSTHTCMLSWLYQTLILARVSLCRHTHACCPGCTRH